MSCIYLIHFERAFKHARHYLGFTNNLASRLDAHKNGSGAALLRHVTASGISWDVVRTWDGATRTDERRIKNTRRIPHYCPICAAKRQEKRRKPK